MKPTAMAKNTTTRRLICPACGEVFEWSLMSAHFQDGRDDAHINLEAKVERHCDDAYFDAEIEILDMLCEEA